jgi:hypothetical protein
MTNYTPNDWIAIMTAAGVLITAVGSAITGILALFLRNEVKNVKQDVAASAAVSDDNKTSLTVLKHQTNDVSMRLQAASLAQGTAEGKEVGRVEGRAEEKANPSPVQSETAKQVD